MSKNHAAPGMSYHAEGHNQGGFDTTENIVADRFPQRNLPFREALYRIAAEHHPATAKQLYYQAARVGIVPTTKAGQRRVKATLTGMRLNSDVPYNWVVDGSRWNRPTTYADIGKGLGDFAENLYRTPLWPRCSNVTVQVWLSNPRLEGVIAPITRECDVPLVVARNRHDLTAIERAGYELSKAGSPCVVYRLNDLDPAKDGKDPLEEALLRFTPLDVVHWRRLGVTPEQVKEYDLPTMKKGIVELESIPPNALREIVRAAIMDHFDEEAANDILEHEGADKSLLYDLAAKHDRCAQHVQCSDQLPF